MSSSTKPPVTDARKFLFDVDFKQEDERLRVESLRQHEQELRDQEAELHQASVRTFSEEEVESIRTASYQDGVRQGRMDSLQEIEQNTAILANAIIDKLGELLASELQREKTAQQIALKTTVSTIKKLWPQVLERLSLEFVETTIRQSLEYNAEEPRIVVRVHDTMLDTIVKRLPQLQEQQAFAGKVIVIADQGILAGDCRVEWADGGLDRLSRTLSQQMDAALNRILSSLISSTPQNTDPERMSS